MLPSEGDALCRAGSAHRAPWPPPDRTPRAAARSRPRAGGRPASAAASLSATHGGDPLADEAGDVVEHIGVVGIDEMILVRRRAVEPARHVLPGEDGDHARHGQRLARLIDVMRAWACGERSTLRCSAPPSPAHQRVVRLAGHDRLGERVGQARAASVLPATSSSTLTMPCNASIDAVIAGAAAEVALERMRQVAGAPRRSKVAAVMIMPAAQKPHWKACASRKACCIGCSLPSLARPSMVVISCPPPRGRRAPGRSGTACRRATPCRRRSRPRRSPS